MAFPNMGQGAASTQIGMGLKRPSLLGPRGTKPPRPIGLGMPKMPAAPSLRSLMAAKLGGGR